MSRHSIGDFLEKAFKPSSLAMRVFMPLVALLVAASLWDKRGVAIGLIAALVYGGLAVATFRPEAVQSWSGTHPVLDSLGLVPLTFLGAALISSWSIATCLAVGVGAWVVMAPIAFWRRRPASQGAASRAVRSEEM